MNPNSRVPTIDDDGFVLWESNAIVRYLADKHGRGSMAPADPRDHADADRWMDWQQTTVLPVMPPIFWGLVRTPAAERKTGVIETARKGGVGVRGLPVARPTRREIGRGSGRARRWPCGWTE